jgi:uracil-DNA glycosylase family 4
MMTLDPAEPALAGPPRDCPLCPRLVDFRASNREDHPDWHNGAVPPFGPSDARLLIVGLAPGLRGANRTARPFTGDYAGELLYPSLIKFGLARGDYRAESDDGLVLIDCRITNAVRCVPPENKPTPLEQKTCRPFLKAEIEALPKLRGILALGRIAHDAVLSTFGLRKVLYPFKHGQVYGFELQPKRKLSLIDCYHCSRYNLNTGVLNEAMFHSALEIAISAVRART